MKSVEVSMWFELAANPVHWLALLLTALALRLLLLAFVLIDIDLCIIGFNIVSSGGLYC